MFANTGARAVSNSDQGLRLTCYKISIDSKNRLRRIKDNADFALFHLHREVPFRNLIYFRLAFGPLNYWPFRIGPQSNSKLPRENDPLVGTSLGESIRKTLPF